MKRILYADKELYDETSSLTERSLNLIERLKANGFDVKVVDRLGILEFYPLGASNISLFKDYERRFNDLLKTIKDYDFFVSHLGVHSPKNLKSILTNIPHLKIAIISDIPGHYESKDRMGVFDYESPEIFNFLK